MEIKVAATKDELFFEEFVCVIEQIPVLKRKPTAKIVDTKKQNIRLLVISICCLALDIFLLIKKQSFTNILGLILLSLCIVLSVFALISHKKSFDNLYTNASDSTIVIDENGIKLITQENEVIQKYEGIDFIKVGLCGFYIIDKKLNGYIMGISNDYKKQVIAEMKKYQPDLVVYDD